MEAGNLPARYAQLDGMLQYKLTSMQYHGYLEKLSEHPGVTSAIHMQMQ